MTTSNDPDEIRADIERTRATLSNDVDDLAESVKPKSVARRQVDKVKDAAGSLKDRVMGSDDDDYSSSSTVGDKASAAKDASPTEKASATEDGSATEDASASQDASASWRAGSSRCLANAWPINARSLSPKKTVIQSRPRSTSWAARHAC